MSPLRPIPFEHSILLPAVVAAFGICMVGVGPAAAQSPASESFEPQAVASTSIGSTATSEVVGHLTPTVGMTLHWADDPVVLRREGEAEPVARLIDNQLKADLQLGFGLFDRIELGAVLPVVPFQSGEASAGLPEARRTDLAEARAQARFHLMRDGGIGVGLQAVTYLPTSQDAVYQSNRKVSGLGALVVDYRSEAPVPWQIAANLGWAFRPSRDTELLAADDRLDWRIAGDVGLWPDRLHAFVSIFGEWEVLSESAMPVGVEMLGGGRIFWGTTGLTSTIGAGGGIFGGYGTADARVVASISYRPGAPGQDHGAHRAASRRRGTGRAGPVADACPTGSGGDDGCPVPDSDGDGIADGSDGCPNRPEDVDTFEDDDGCPDRDNDGDDIGDFSDACPLEAGRRAYSGCPFVDNDEDGIDASVDSCPDAKEDDDRFEDDDGCPDDDNDRDGIVDTRDKCPEVPEAINGIEDDDGCPDEGDGSVQLTGNRIEILERVYFDTSRASIKPRSHSVLDQVASVMKAHPDIRRLRVRGHTDARGSEKSNLKLSQQRAVSVKEYLVNQEVEAERLSARGYGETHPIASNDTAEGRAKNRRVEFHIVERGTP